jgi:acetyl-CoA carboxylase biotin carboxyl carrier protein
MKKTKTNKTTTAHKTGETIEQTIETLAKALELHNLGSIHYASGVGAHRQEFTLTKSVPAQAANMPSSEAVSVGANQAKTETTKPLAYITSPMVGTFYSAPNPSKPNFIEVGNVVHKDTVVCIIEAMKIMNQIQSEVAGRIVECLVTNGTVVEFGTALFAVEVAD